MSINTGEKDEVPEVQPLQENEKKPEIENKSFIQKLWHIKSQISVEPIVAGLVIPTMLSRLAVQNLNLDKSCRVNLKYGDLICDELLHRTGNSTMYEAEVQRVISNIEAWKSVIQTAVPAFFVVFMGAWSDRTGNRKVCILLPIFGDFLVCLSNILSTVFFYEISLEITMFLEAFLPAITGGWGTVYLGVYSYIIDITDKESRTFRLGLVSLCHTAGVPIGTALSGVLLKLLGYYGVFAICSAMYLATLFYGFLRLKRKTKVAITVDEKVESSILTNFVSLVKETAMVAFQKREGKTRKKIIVILMIVAIIYGPNHGERIIKYLYVRYKLKWDAVKYSMYSTYSVITHSFGVLFSIAILSKRWGFHDSVLCLISIVSKLFGSILLAFVSTDLEIFMVPIVEILNSTTFTSLRSMISKMVRSEEMGKTNSVFSLVETMGALMFDPTYSALYANTLTIFTGTVFLFSATLTFPPIGLVIWIYLQYRRETKQRRLSMREKEDKLENVEIREVVVNK